MLELNKYYFLGLVKFFKNDNYLDDLINGVFYCNTPEYYRLSDQEGVSDHNESCILSYRANRGDEQLRMTFGGVEVPGITSVTMYDENKYDMYLHCWSSIIFTLDDDKVLKLIKDLNRLRKEFGNNYVFIPYDKLKTFIERLKFLTNNNLQHGFIKYSNDDNERTVFCKSVKYSYQREYRFATGKCEHTDNAPLIIKDDIGFHNYMEKNISINIEETITGKFVFNLDTDRCFSDFLT
jgi:hypothetical protein